MSLALFIYDTIFSQKYLVVDILHYNIIYISNAFRLTLLCPCRKAKIKNGGIQDETRRFKNKGI